MSFDIFSSEFFLSKSTIISGSSFFLIICFASYFVFSMAVLIISVCLIINETGEH